MALKANYSERLAQYSSENNDASQAKVRLGSLGQQLAVHPPLPPIGWHEVWQTAPAGIFSLARWIFPRALKLAMWIVLAPFILALIFVVGYMVHGIVGGIGSDGVGLLLLIFYLDRINDRLSQIERNTRC